MRAALAGLLIAPALALTLRAAPAAGQVRVGVHIDVPIVLGGHGGVVIHRPAPPPPPRYVEVYDYSRGRYGDWRKDSRKWVVVSLWWADGRYYERPVPHGREVLVYRYHDEFFREPFDRDWYSYRDRTMRDRRDDRWNDPRDNRPGDYRDRNDRDDHDRNGWDPRDSRDDRDNRGARDPRDDHRPEPARPEPPRNERARPRVGG